MVAIGCIGEWYLFKQPAEHDNESEHRARELRFIMMVAMGVTMEVVALAHSIPEALRLERTIAGLTRSNLVLRSNVVVLELKTQPRRITLRQKEQFIKFLREYPKGPVKIYLGRQDDELIDYAKHIRDILDAAGYGTGKDPGVIPLGEMAGMYRPIGDDSDIGVSVFLMFYSTNTLTFKWPGIWDLTNETSYFLTGQKDDPRAVPIFIKAAFREIGVQTLFSSTQDLLSPGQWGVYIRQKY